MMLEKPLYLNFSNADQRELSEPYRESQRVAAEHRRQIETLNAEVIKYKKRSEERQGQVNVLAKENRALISKCKLLNDRQALLEDELVKAEEQIKAISSLLKAK